MFSPLPGTSYKLSVNVDSVRYQIDQQPSEPPFLAHLSTKNGRTISVSLEVSGSLSNQIKLETLEIVGDTIKVKCNRWFIS